MSAEDTLGWSCRCANRAPHEPHWHTIRADGITVATGWCDGYRNGEPHDTEGDG